MNDSSPMKANAVISSCQKYRFLLTRDWWASGPRMTWLMLNPSTADALVDDPTVKRCVSYAKAWGCSGLDVVNLVPWRATDPKELFTVPWGKLDHPDNWGYFDRSVRANALVVCGWGSTPEKHLALANKANVLLRYLNRLGTVPHCLKTSRNGSPVHPLYQKKDLKPVPFLR